MAVQTLDFSIYILTILVGNATIIIDQLKLIYIAYRECIALIVIKVFITDYNIS